MQAGVRVSGLTVDIPGRRLLDGVQLRVDPGEIVAIVGPSGSGKTTLLNCLAGISPTPGATTFVGGLDLADCSTARRASHRLRHIGLVLQFGELLPEFTALENVVLPLRLLGVGPAPAQQRAQTMLEQVGVAELARVWPDQLSGGETQRVALSRALVHRPSVVIADEPTGSLDEANASSITELLVRAARHLNATVIMATHDHAVAERADRVLRLRKGSLVEPVAA